MMKSLTIAILNFNSGEYLSKCLESLKTVYEEAEISVVVIDNNSTDASFKEAKSEFKILNLSKTERTWDFLKAIIPP